jgi:GDP-L-fucose synthase
MNGCINKKFWEGKKVLVTGGAGFVGSNLCEFLIQYGAIVTVADNLERGTKDNLKNTIDKIEFVECDLMNLDNCLSVTKGQDIVMNLAAKACGVEYSVAHHGEMLMGNAVLGMNILEACRLNGVKKVLVVSSSCVYSDDAPTPTYEGDYIGIPEKVNEGYGWGKIMMEKQAMYYSKEYNMDIAIARPSNIYGVGDIYDGTKSHVIPSLINRILKKRLSKDDRPLLIWGSGNQSRAFIHRADVCCAFMLLVEHYACGDPVNVGHKNSTTIKELACHICDICGVEKDFRFDLSKPEGTFKKSVSCEKLESVTGFVPKTSFSQGLRDMVIDCARDFGQGEAFLANIIKGAYCIPNPNFYV